MKVAVECLKGQSEKSKCDNCWGISIKEITIKEVPQRYTWFCRLKRIYLEDLNFEEKEYCSDFREDAEMLRSLKEFTPRSLWNWFIERGK